ncbi:TPA: hypothetical protein QDB04_000074 [Burkholderia vietnamiensis]|nr:hypothetical protein [Burkholderia vietnamiensis]
MKSVRVVAVGLLLGGILMLLSAQSYFHLVLSALGLGFVQTTLDAFTPMTAALAGHPEMSVLVSALVCTGVGLIVSSVFYSVVEDAIAMVAVGVPALLALAVTEFGKFVVRKIRQRRVIGA